MLDEHIKPAKALIKKIWKFQKKYLSADRLIKKKIRPFPNVEAIVEYSIIVETNLGVSTRRCLSVGTYDILSIKLLSKELKEFVSFIHLEETNILIESVEYWIDDNCETFIDKTLEDEYNAYVNESYLYGMEMICDEILPNFYTEQESVITWTEDTDQYSKKLQTELSLVDNIHGGTTEVLIRSNGKIDIDHRAICIDDLRKIVNIYDKQYKSITPMTSMGA